MPDDPGMTIPPALESPLLPVGAATGLAWFGSLEIPDGLRLPRVVRTQR